MSRIKNRIVEYIDSKHVTQYEFCKKTGIASGILNRSTGISEDNIAKFIKFYPEVDINWLITGNKKGIPVSVRKHKEQSESDVYRAKKLPSRNAAKLEVIYDEMKSMMQVVQELKDEIKYQKNMVDSISKQIQHSEVATGKKQKRKAVFKSKSSGKKPYGLLKNSI